MSHLVDVSKRAISGPVCESSSGMLCLLSLNASSSKRRTIAVLLLSIVLTGAAFLPMPALATGIKSCQAAFSRTVRLENEIQNLSLLVYNVENLFATVGKFERKDPTTFEPVPGKSGKNKQDSHVEEIIRIIQSSRADVIVLTEVESQSALEALSAQHLQGKYVPHLIAGNDSRGINIGFMVKSDLPWEVSIKSHRHIEWHDVQTDRKAPLFTRDLPVLEFRRQITDLEPVFVVFGNHAKSQRDLNGDPKSRRWRAMQYLTATAIVSQYRQKSIPVIFAGDFNTDVRYAPEVEPLKKLLGSAFDYSVDAPSLEKRITHTYHPFGRATELSQLDDVMVSRDLAASIDSASIVRYRDRNGALKPFPKTQEERNQQPSDHFPVLVRLRTHKLLGSMNR